MRKIPTLFKRDPENMKHVLPEVHPDCQWVLDGEGTATRKYDGTCTMFDGEQWWARREVKPGKQPPANYRPVETDETTGKTVGWEPVEQSAFAKFHAEALAYRYGIVDPTSSHPVAGVTYELVGPKINGNPEKASWHLLVRHGYWAGADIDDLRDSPRDFDGLRGWMFAHPEWEGIVWHHPDGRMAKLKVKDFPCEAA